MKFGDAEYMRIVNRLPDGAIGSDAWGCFYNITGFESPGHCFWCGKETKGRYCRKTNHGDLYRDNTMWGFASRACIKRYQVGEDTNLWGEPKKVYCHDCGIESKKGIKFQVHHVIPLNNEYRAIHVLNNQKNLVLLCNKCHGVRHREWNYLMRKNLAAEIGIKIKAKKEQLEDRQLTFRI